MEKNGMNERQIIIHNCAYKWEKGEKERFFSDSALAFLFWACY